MIVPTLAARKPTMDDVKRAADEYNKMAHGRPGRGSSRGYTMRILSSHG